jgi:hypothetical protein
VMRWNFSQRLPAFELVDVACPGPARDLFEDWPVTLKEKASEGLASSV